jgi:hypothetical protein
MELNNEMSLLTKQQITIANWINNLDSHNDRAREILYLVRKVVKEDHDIEDHGFDELFTKSHKIVDGHVQESYKIKEGV